MNFPSFEGSKLFSAIHNPYCDTIIDQNEVNKKEISSPHTKSYAQKIIDDRLKNKSNHFFGNLALNLFSVSYKEDNKRAKEEFEKKKIAKNKEIRNLKDDKRTLDYNVPKALKHRKDRQTAIENNNYNKQTNSILLNTLPEIFTEVLCKLPKNNDIAAVLCTSKLAKTRMLPALANKFHWETKTKLPYDTTIPYTEQLKMYKEVGIEYPALINALGGLKRVYDFPVLEIEVDEEEIKESSTRGSLLSLPVKRKGIEYLKPNDLTHPIMRGIWQGRPFIAVRYQTCNDGEQHVAVFLRGQPGTGPKWWNVIDQPYGYLALDMMLGYTTSDPIHDRIREEEILSRLSRIVNYKKIGYLKDLPPRDGTFDPQDPPVIANRMKKSPDNYYYYGGKYEVQPKPKQRTALVLWDPSKTKEEIAEIVKNMTE